MNERSRARPIAGNVPPWWGSLVVVAVALLSFFWALTARDVTQAEVGLLHTLGDLLAPAIGVDDPEQYTAHLPLAWILRWVFQSVLGEDSVLAWRAHAAIGATVAAVLTWWCLYRSGRPGHAVAAGLLVAVNPILSFHAHDATNYALGPLTGVLVVIGLSDLVDGRRTAVRYLVAGLLLGAFNDFFFAFVGLAALVLTLVALRQSREPFRTRRLALRSWGIVGGVIALPVILLAVRLAGSHFGEVISYHADVSSLQWTLLDALREGYGAFVVAQAEGYRSIAEPDPWLNAAPVVLLPVALVLAFACRRSPIRIAGHLLALTLVLFLGWTTLFSAVMGFRFTDPPRAYTALIPALAIVWSHALLSMGPRAGVVLFSLFLLTHGAVTARQVLGVSDTQAWAAARITEFWRPGDGLFDAVTLNHRLAPETIAGAERNCLSDGPIDADRVWIATFPFRHEPGAVPHCGGLDVWRPLESGYRVRLHERHDVPSYEKNTNSFLTEASLVLIERGHGKDTGEPVELTLRFEHGFLSGVRRGWLEVTLSDRPESPKFSQDLAQTVVLGPIPDGIDVLLLDVHPPQRGPWLDRLPRFLAQPFTTTVASYAVPVCCEEPVASSSTLALPPLCSPWITAGRRLASVLVALGIVWVPIPPLVRAIRRRSR